MHVAAWYVFSALGNGGVWTLKPGLGMRVEVSAFGLEGGAYKGHLEGAVVGSR